MLRMRWERSESGGHICKWYQDGDSRAVKERPPAAAPCHDIKTEKPTCDRESCWLFQSRKAWLSTLFILGVVFGLSCHYSEPMFKRHGDVSDPSNAPAAKRITGAAPARQRVPDKF